MTDNPAPAKRCDGNGCFIPEPHKVGFRGCTNRVLFTAPAPAAGDEEIARQLVQDSIQEHHKIGSIVNRVKLENDIVAALRSARTSAVESTWKQAAEKEE